LLAGLLSLAAVAVVALEIMVLQLQVAQVAVERVDKFHLACISTMYRLLISLSARVVLLVQQRRRQVVLVVQVRLYLQMEL
jgi:hypothetical protein